MKVDDRIAKWAGILTIFFFDLSTLSMFYCFSAIPYETKDYYGTTINSFNTITVLGFLLGFLGTPFSLLFADRYGPGINVIVALVGLAGTVTLRLLSVYSEPASVSAYGLFYASQLLCKVPQVMILWLPTKMTSLFFTEKERTVANAVATIPQLLAIMLGYIFGPLFIAENAAGQLEFQKLMWATSATGIPAVFLGLFYLAIFGARGLPRLDKCPTVTSIEIVRSVNVREPSLVKYTKTYLWSLIICYKDWRGYGCLTVLAGVGNSIGVILITATTQILCAYGYDKAVVSFEAVAIMVLTGLIATVIVSKISDLYQCPSLAMQICAWGVVLTFWFVALISTTVDNTALVLLSYALLGIAVLPCMPLNHELSVECTYPVGVALASGWVGVMQELCMFIFAVIFFGIGREVVPEDDIYGIDTCNTDEDLVVKDYKTSLLVLAVSGTVIGGSALALFKCPYKRKHADHETVG